MAIGPVAVDMASPVATVVVAAVRGIMRVAVVSNSTVGVVVAVTAAIASTRRVSGRGAWRKRERGPQSPGGSERNGR
jgi:hypothetical protein